MARKHPADKCLRDPPLVIRIRGAVGPMRGLVDKDLRRLLHERPDDATFTELAKTRFEQMVIRESVRGLNAVRKDFGLVPLRIPTNRIHVMDSDAFDEHFHKKGESASQGLAAVSRAYVKRKPDRSELIGTVTHEISHLSAFTAYVVDTDLKFGDGGVEGDAVVSQRRGGMRFGKDGFVGLNEAVTETIAVAVRRKMAETSLFPRRLMRRVLECGAYEPHTAVLDRVMRELFEKPDYGYTLAIWDFFTGSNDFLREIRRKRPEMLPVLRAMDNTDRGALKAARALGFDEEVRDIRKIMRAARAGG